MAEIDRFVITEEWICQKLKIENEHLDDIKSLSLQGTYNEKISHLGSSLFNFTRIKELDLSRNSLVCVDGLASLTLLTKLNLYYNNLSSLRELEKLKQNDQLTDLDLRLNPVTKEEKNDYRLFLIHVMPQLGSLDDRPIKDTEKQMSSQLFGQNKTTTTTSTTTHNNNKNNNKNTNTNAYTNANEADENFEIHNNHNNDKKSSIRSRSSRRSSSNSSSSSSRCRIMSVMNIAKRSAGLTTTTTTSEDLGQNEDEEKRRREDDDEIGSYEPLNLGSHLLSKSSSMQNLNSLNLQLMQMKTKTTNANDKFYADFNVDDDQKQTKNRQQNNKTEEQKGKSVIFSSSSSSMNNNGMIKNEIDDDFNDKFIVLLDLVDRYWNGSKSLHTNYKFIDSAKRLLLFPKTTSANVGGEKENHNSDWRTQKRLLVEENKRLSEQQNQNQNTRNQTIEMNELKKKCLILQTENRQLTKKMMSQQQQQQHQSQLSSLDATNNDTTTIEKQNVMMKRDIEIMRIKLKQYEQLQQLTMMLQESHKSLVTTNEHLLNEMSSSKQQQQQQMIMMNPSSPLQRQYQDSTSTNSLNFASYVNHHSHPASSSSSSSSSSTGSASTMTSQNLAKSIIKKQFDQLNNNLNLIKNKT